MLEKLSSSPFLQNVVKQLEIKPSLAFDSITETEKACLLAFILTHTKRSILLISGKEQHDHFLDDFKYFTRDEALEFPAWDTLPSENVDPNKDLVGKRLEILSEIIKAEKPLVVVSSIQGALQKIASISSLEQSQTTWKQGQTLSFDKLEKFLSDFGYVRESITTDKGQFSLRGGILDIFPMASSAPCRIEFFDDEIETIKIFDPISQKSMEACQSVFISHANEKKLIENEQSTKTLFDHFSKPPLIVFDNLVTLEDKYFILKNSLAASAKEHFDLSLFDVLLDQNKTIFLSEEPFNVLFQDLKIQKSFDPFSPQEMEFELFGKRVTSYYHKTSFAKVDDLFVYDEATSSHMDHLLHAIDQSPFDGTCYLLHSNDSEKAALEKALKKLDLSLPEKAHFQEGYLTSGIALLDKKIALIPFPEFTKQKRVRRKKWRTSYHTPASEFHELSAGDLVVHFHNGIGKYLGIEKQKNHLGQDEEFMIIEYASSSKLYVPLSQSHLVSRYIGSHEESPKLHTLGTTKWQVAKQRAQKSILGYAKDLLHVQAEREAKGGYEYPSDSEDMLFFEEEFPFVETDDQLRAIADIKRDMQSKNAMDRLICGDVGYGKTEVAMRAAFKAVIDGNKQVAVLVPTTTLTMQHLETFSQRMANFGVKVKALSRMSKTSETKLILNDLEKGHIDILVGTHRLLSSDLKFKDLGLLIIDEEQRFGVRAKETLKKAKIGVDCLTLSATPIPRTLYMSIIGARDLSVINTPPHDRLPIKSIIAERDLELIKIALLRELSRDGQAYFIHNRVESIYRVKEELSNLVPQAKIQIAHGQQNPKNIDETFHAFKTGSVDILLATTIVESGIDIPNANTIFIDRAQTFGLADLYQLRGRVGRWNKPASCYFLVPEKKLLSEISQKRLNALAQNSGFGGGMKLALRDLEIRGAGDILGVQQSGQVSSVGFHLYCKMLKKAVDSIKSKKSISFVETKIESKYPACIPETYIQETSIRLELYHRFGDITKFEEVESILEEIKDRFGTLPNEVLWLGALSKLKLFGSNHFFHLLKYGKNILEAHHQGGKTLLKKKIPFPEVPTPDELVDFTLKALEQNFSLKQKSLPKL